MLLPFPPHTELGVKFTGRHGWKQLTLPVVASPCKVGGIPGIVWIGFCSDLHVSSNTQGTDPYDLIDLGSALGGLDLDGKEMCLRPEAVQ